MTNKKLIFFDIDGTLTSELDSTMLESTKQAILQARKNGHKCIVNTGRTNKLVKDWLPQLVTFDGYLCGCGTHIIYENETLLHQTFDAHISQRIVEGLRRYEIDAVLEGSENNYHEPIERMHTKEFQEFARQFQELGFGTCEDAIGNFDKFYCYAPRPDQMPGFRQEFEQVLDFIDREKGFYEIVPKGYSKASAIEYIADYLNMPMTATVAIGDSNNDLQMLSCVETPIAMGNGNAQVKQIAKYVTTDVEQDGIYHALEWLGVL